MSMETKERKDGALSNTPSIGLESCGIAIGCDKAESNNWIEEADSVDIRQLLKVNSDGSVTEC